MQTRLRFHCSHMLPLVVFTNSVSTCYSSLQSPLYGEVFVINAYNIMCHFLKAISIATQVNISQVSVFTA